MKRKLILVFALLAIIITSTFVLIERARAPEQTTPVNNTATDLSEGGKYLVIKEWGVKFELPAELRGDIEYKYTEANGTTGKPIVELTSKTISAGAMKCAANENGTRKVLQINKFDTTIYGTDPEKFNPRPFKVIPEAKGMFTLSQTECEEAATREKNTEVLQLIASLKAAIQNSLAISNP